MRRLVLGLVALLVALGAAASLPHRATAPARRQSSVPDDGADLQQSPSTVTITFGEAPDPKLSSIQVISTSGQQFQGPTTAVPGNPLELQVALTRQLPTGVYTVNWRTFSHVDGHVAGGAFAFGVRANPSGVNLQPTAIAAPPGPSALDITGRALLYVGLVVLVGGAVIAVAVLPRLPRPVLRTLPAGWALAAAGTAAVVVSQARNAGAGWGQIFSTSIGTALVERTIPVAIAGMALLLCLGARDLRRRIAVAAVGVAAAWAMLADVMNSHAAAGSDVAVNMALQWAHIAAGAVWLGGLFALLLGIRSLEGEERGRAVRRFSLAAGVCIVAVAATGTIRAVVEIGSWGSVLTTTFGALVVVKACLLVALAGLGAVNRFRNVPRASRVVSGLQRVASVEVIVAVGVLAVAAALVNEEPPASIRALAAKNAPQQLVLTASDYGTSVRMRLTITPGSTGPNRFSAYLTDYDTGKPIEPQGVQLSFAAPSCQSLGPTTLALKRTAPGTWAAAGSNLALGTTWQVTALVDRGSASVEIPFTVNPKVPAQTLSVTPGGGLPTLYTITLPVGKLQIYIDPEQAGPVELHTTYFDQAGNGLNAVVSSVEEAGQSLPTRQLGPGHYVSDATVKRGTNRFDIAATAGCQQLTSHIDIPVR
jgi:copper transport protein